MVRFGIVAVVALALVTVPEARAACEVPLPGEPSTGEELCGPVDQDPPPATEGPGTTSAPHLVAWASGFDINPFNGNRLGIWIARVDGTAKLRVRARILDARCRPDAGSTSLTLEAGGAGKVTTKQKAGECRPLERRA